MSEKFAKEFFDIPATLETNTALRDAVVALIQSEPMPAKVLEGGNRLEIFRSILTDLAKGRIELDESYLQTQTEISRQTSPHSFNNKVFAHGWAMRQVRTQFSRFYNQAILEKLHNEGETMCFIPHSDSEDVSSPCTRLLAGQLQRVDILYQRLINSYAKGNWSKEVKIPNHPHCTHVVMPVEAQPTD